MTLYDEGKVLRREVEKLRPDKRRRYPEELRRRILSWVERAMDAGMQEHECSKMLGVKAWRFTMWRRREARTARVEVTAKVEAEPSAKPLALVPIEVPSLPPIVGLSLVTPSGYRVEGLSLEQLAALLPELA